MHSIRFVFHISNIFCVLSETLHTFFTFSKELTNKLSEAVSTDFIVNKKLLFHRSTIEAILRKSPKTIHHASGN